MSCRPPGRVQPYMQQQAEASGRLCRQALLRLAAASQGTLSAADSPASPSHGTGGKDLSHAFTVKQVQTHADPDPSSHFVFREQLRQELRAMRCPL